MGKLKLPRLTLVSIALYIFIKILSLDSVGVLNGYFMIIINLSLINVIFTVSLNLINGITGQFSLGHMGFAAVGAYVTGTITTLVFKLSPDVASNYPIFIGALILGGLCAALVGLIIGFPSLRLKGDYLAIMTLGFGEVIRIILNNINYVGGPAGLRGVPKFSTFTIIYIFTFITIVLIRNLVQSSHGRAMLSVRENEVASELVGVSTTKYKVLGFVIGAFFAGIGGGLLDHLIQIAVPTQFGFYASALLLVFVYAGGMGSITGSIIAAFGLTFLLQFLQIGLDTLSNITGTTFGSEWRMVIYSLLLILIMLFKTEGLMGMKEAKLLVIEEDTK